MSGLDCARFPPIPCPYCGGVLDATSNPKGGTEPPKDGDRSLCFRCVMPAVFVVNSLGVSLRPSTLPELDEFMATHQDYMELLKAFHRGLRARHVTRESGIYRRPTYGRNREQE